ncbi:hypothetical protein PybrP1_008638 [[Pythium] brassicae (nom. inval.)]|nr:hypothetical protein PybrP1_008638 [[Pythium] brassicae (nom. inval.)]
MGDRDGPAWCPADTSLLVRAWAAAAAQSAPAAAAASAVFQHFRRLSPGGASGRAEKSVQWRRAMLSNTHAIICSYNSRAPAAAAAAPKQPATQTTADVAASTSPWFALPEAERRRCFAELNQKASAQYTPLTEAQFAAICKLKSLVATGSSGAADEPPAQPANALSARLVKWATADTTRLLRAWADAAAAAAPKTPTARAVARRFEQLSEGGCSGRSLVSVVQKHANLLNVFAVIRVHDAAGPPRRWFSASDRERRRFFAETSKVAWMKFVDLTAEQFDALTAIHSDARGSDEAAEDASLAPSEVENVADASKRLLVPRAPWSDADMARLLRAWANVRLDTRNAHPAGVEVVLEYNRLSSGCAGKQASDSAVCLKHFVTHNMYTIICEYNARVGGHLSQPSPTPSWFTLSDDERRTFFSSANMNLTYWFMDLSEEHFRFIADTRNNDGVGDVSSKRRHAGKQPRETWTSEHTTLMLRAWQEAVAESRSRKPATSTVFRRFVALLRGPSGAEKAFANRYRSLRFAHSVVRIFVKQYSDEHAGHSDDAGRGDVESLTEAALDKWFSMSAVDRRRYFNGANGKSHSFMDLTRAQFDILARIMASSGVSMPTNMTSGVFADSPAATKQQGTSARSAPPESPSQLAVAKKPNLPAWQRLSKSISQAFRLKSKRAAGVLTLTDDSHDGDKYDETDGNHESALSKLSQSAHRSESETTGDDGITAGCTASSSSAQPSIADAIPAEFPLVQYVAECCLLLQQQQQQPPSLSPLQIARTQQQPLLDDIESRLFFKCVELEKWALAHTLAEKMQRRMATCSFRQDRRRSQDRSPAHSRRRSDVQRRRSARRGSDEPPDEVLRFLDTCAS